MVDDKPAWDDGQPWEIIIEEQNGIKTSVFLDYIQLGNIEPTLINTDEGQELLLIIRYGADIRLITITYNSPGKFHGCKLYSGVVEAYSKNWEMEEEQ